MKLVFCWPLLFSKFRASGYKLQNSHVYNSHSYQVDHVSTKRSLTSFSVRISSFITRPAEVEEENKENQENGESRENGDKLSQSTQVNELIDASRDSLSDLSLTPWNRLWWETCYWLYCSDFKVEQFMRTKENLFQTPPTFQGSERSITKRKALFATPSQPLDLLDTIT